VVPLLLGSRWELLGDNLWLTGDAPLSSGAGRGATSGAGACRARRTTGAWRGPGGPS